MKTQKAGHQIELTLKFKSSFLSSDISSIKKME